MKRGNLIPPFSHFATLWAAHLRVTLLLAIVLAAMTPAQAQTFRFSLRADPDVIPANGISTTSILVQVQNTGDVAIAAVPIVHFIASQGTIESQTRLSGGIARVMLRSSTKPGTALITAFIGNSREQIAVEFSDDATSFARYMDVSGTYVAYGDEPGIVTASGKCELNYGDLHIESDVRLDIEIDKDQLWAEGSAGNVVIRSGAGAKAHELRGDRLYYDLLRRRGIVRRSDTTLGPLRQEFSGSDFAPLNPGSSTMGGAISHGDAVNRRSPDAPGAAGSGVVDATTRVPDMTPAMEPPRSEVANDVVGPRPGIIELHSARELTTGHDNRQDAVGVVLSRGRARESSGLLLNEGATPSTVTSYKMEDPRSIGGGTASITPTSGFDGARRAPVNPGQFPQTPPIVPAYRPLDPTVDSQARIVEPLPPEIDVTNGYWVAARRLSMYPRDKIQFEKATLFLNGGKLFSMPRYVVPLNGTFNPGQDMMAFNSSGGLSLNIPYYYQASSHGEGTIYFQHAPRNGFAAEKSGFSLALDQKYWMSRRSSGRVIVDQLGAGNWNFNWQHKLQLTPTTSANMSFDMPQHRDAYARASLLKDFGRLQMGLESSYSRPRSGLDDFQGQFYARLRPREIRHTGWTYVVSANASMWQRYPELVATSGGGGGGGVGLPGRPRPGSGTETRYRSVVSQTVDLTLDAPIWRLWKGATLNSSFRLTGFNQSLGRRGAAPGFNFGLTQNLGRKGLLQVDYSYNKTADLFAAGSLTHLVNASLLLTPGKRLALNALITKSLADHSFYGSTSLDYMLAPKWRMGLFSEYSTFDASSEDFLDYGWTLGRAIGQRELTLNWSQQRHRVYFEIGGFRL